MSDRSRLILAIETSNPSAWTPGLSVMPGVAVGVAERDGVRTLAVRACDPTRRDDELMPAIDGAIRDAGGSPRDIERIAVSIGPGGFTPLRIAATVVKVLAYATGAHIVPIPSAEVVAARVKRDGAAFAVALASKNSDAWVSAFNAQSTTARWSGLLDAGGIAALGIRRLIADSFLPQSMRTQASELGIAIEAPVFDPVACLERSLSGTVEIPMALAPLYPREPEAVRKWRELHPRT